MKKLTIGITVYNNNPFLEELLYVLKNEIELFPNLREEIDIKIYDDCSTNFSTRETLIKYESDFTVIRATENSGSPAKGRNCIIEEAETEYILFIDGDDTIVSNLSSIHRELCGKDADIFVSNVTKVLNDGIRSKSPFIYSDILFCKENSPKNLYKMTVHQTG
ncbi:MAG: glycosyltransferase family 2 protein, partial [Anaerovoracaceae bacterium]